MPIWPGKYPDETRINTHTHTQKQMKEGAEDHGEKSTAGATTTGTRGEEK